MTLMVQRLMQDCVYVSRLPSSVFVTLARTHKRSFHVVGNLVLWGDFPSLLQYCLSLKDLNSDVSKLAYALPLNMNKLEDITFIT
jgi:hypothetical protein